MSLFSLVLYPLLRSFKSSVTSLSYPSTVSYVSEALLYLRQRAVIEEEMLLLQQNNAYELVHLPAAMFVAVCEFIQ